MHRLTADIPYSVVSASTSLGGRLCVSLCQHWLLVAQAAYSIVFSSAWVKQESRLFAYLSYHSKTLISEQSIAEMAILWSSQQHLITRLLVYLGTHSPHICDAHFNGWPVSIVECSAPHVVTGSRLRAYLGAHYKRSVHLWCYHHYLVFANNAQYTVYTWAFTVHLWCMVWLLTSHLVLAQNVLAVKQSGGLW